MDEFGHVLKKLSNRAAAPPCCVGARRRKNERTEKFSLFYRPWFGGERSHVHLGCELPTRGGGRNSGAETL
jgi:hypothetical protein